MRRFGYLIIVALFAVTACTPQATPAPTPTPEPELTGVIVLGDIDADDPISKIEEFQPIADYLAANLTDFGIGSGEVQIAPDLDTMISLVESGEIDVYYDSLYPAMLVGSATNSQPLVRGWRGGEPVYHSVFFVLADSGLTSLDDLNGQLVAYDDRTSTSGYMIPTSYLISNGLNPVEKASVESSVADDEVGYIFSEDDETTIEWVLNGQVAAGVVDNLTYMSDIPEETQDNLVILAESDDVPRRVVMVGPDVDPELVDALVDLFLGMDETEEGPALLATLKTTQFDEFPGGTEAVFDPIQEMLDVIVDR